jgi:hypothetical protein
MHLQPANSYKCMQLTPKTASVVPPEDGRLTPETCRGLTLSDPMSDLIRHYDFPVPLLSLM